MIEGAAGIAGIVLAGGRSSRFGSDKLQARVDETTLLERALDALRPVCAELVVVVAPGDRRDLPPDIVLATDPEPYGGPLVGIRAGLARTTRPIALVVAGDMPWLDPAVLALLADALGDGDAGAALEASPDGPRAIEPLPLALRTAPALAAVDRLLASGERRLGALLLALAPRVVTRSDWRALDPEGRTLRDVDRPADLADGETGA